MAKKPIKELNKDENGVNDLIADLDKMKKELKDKQEALEQIEENEKIEEFESIEDLTKSLKKVRIVNPFLFPKKPKKEKTDYSFTIDVWKKCPEPCEINPIDKTKNPLKKRKVTYQKIAKTTL